MQQAIRRLRCEARSLARGKPPTAIRYSVAFRSEALEVAQRLQAQGVSVARIARDLGVRPKTLALWLRRGERRRMRRVVVVPSGLTEPQALRPVLVTVGGIRVEGLDLDAVVHVLRRLA